MTTPPINHTQCSCFACQLIDEGSSVEEVDAAIDKKMRADIDKYGFAIHKIIEVNGYTYHTHGFDKLGHPDFEIVIPIKDETVQQLFDDMYKAVLKGFKIVPGAIYSKIFDKMNIKFVRANESGRAVMRFILPNSEGTLERLILTGRFQDQYNGSHVADWAHPAEVIPFPAEEPADEVPS